MGIPAQTHNRIHTDRVKNGPGKVINFALSFDIHIENTNTQ